jgi:TolA-binding protein
MVSRGSPRRAAIQIAERAGDPDPGGCRAFFLSGFIAACTTSREEQLYKSAQEYWDKKMYGMAAEKYEQVFHINPDSPKAEQSLYKAAFIQGYYLQEPSRAIDLFLRIPIRYPDGPYRLKTHQHLAEIFATHLKSYPQAIAQYDTLIDLRKRTGEDLSELYQKKAHCYFLMEDWENARKIHEKSLKEYPRGAAADKAAYQIGYIYFLEGKQEAAERALRFFLETYPDSDWAFDGMLHLARAKEEQHQTVDSDALYRRIRERFPERVRDIKKE